MRRVYFQKAATLFIAIAMTFLSHCFRIPDMYDTDTVRFMLTYTCFAITVLSLFSPASNRPLYFIARAWWLQLGMPIILTVVAIIVTSIGR